MAMLEAVAELTLERLNHITRVWVEQAYHPTVHKELGTTPLQRYLDPRQLGRPCPDSETLHRTFSPDRAAQAAS